MNVTDNIQISRDRIGLVDYGDTDNEEPAEEGEVNVENGNILVNIMNNNVEEMGNHNKNVTTPISFRRTDLDLSPFPEENNRRLTSSFFMLPFISGEDANSNVSGSSDHECESSCEISTNDDEEEGTDRSYQGHACASSGFVPIHWLSRQGSNGNVVTNKDTEVQAASQGLDTFDDNANDGCDDEEIKTGRIINVEQTDDFQYFSKSKRSKLRNAVQDFDLRSVLGIRGSKENTSSDFDVFHDVSVMAEKSVHEGEIEALQSKIKVHREHFKDLAKEKEENQMNLAMTVKKKIELEEELQKLSQKHKYFNEKRIEIEGNIAFTEYEIKKDTDNLLRALRSHEKARANHETEQGPDNVNASMSVTVRNPSFDEPKDVPLVDSVRNVNINERTRSTRDFGRNVNVSFISNRKPKQSEWKMMDESYFLTNSGPDFFDYLHQNRVTNHPKEIYKCQLCSVNVKGRKTLLSHLRGKKHGAKLCDVSDDANDEFGHKEIVQDWERNEEDKEPSSDLRYLLKRKRESV